MEVENLVRTIDYMLASDVESKQRTAAEKRWFARRLIVALARDEEELEQLAQLAPNAAPQTARELFLVPNIMTPEVVSCRWLVPGKVAVELSYGEGFPREDGSRRVLWGVSIHTWPPNRDIEDIDECFGSEAEARAYIKELGSRLKS